MLIQNVIWWFVFASLSLVFELKTAGFFYFLSFSTGALSAGIAAWYNYSLEQQFFLFGVIALVSFFILKRCVGVMQQRHVYHSNVDALIGKEGTVHTALLEHGTGYVILKGQKWLAQDVHKHAIAQDTIVQVVRVEGIKLIVKVKE